MASNRTLVLSLISAVILTACAGTEEVKTVQKPTKVEQTATVSTQVSTTQQEVLDFDIDKYRTSLSDPSSTKSNELPESFITEAVAESTNEIESNIGFRIQLISTSDRTRAQKAIADFNEWLFSNESIIYKAETYIIFKQPNYRVHIGDFKTRIQANEFIKIVKRRFSDAWIIQDKIIEDRTPDSIQN